MDVPAGHAIEATPFPNGFSNGTAPLEDDLPLMSSVAPPGNTVTRSAVRPAGPKMLLELAADLNVPLEELPEEWADFTPEFVPPAMPSVVSMADAAVKRAGVVPGFAKLAAEGIQFELSVSLHAPNDALRSELMPVNRRWRQLVLPSP